MAEPFRHRLRVRWSECDLQGVVFYPQYLAYLDHTVTELWREAIGPYTEMIPTHGVDMVVAEAGMRYRGSARFDDELEIAASRHPPRQHLDHHGVHGSSGCPTARCSPRASCATSSSIPSDFSKREMPASRALAALAALRPRLMVHLRIVVPADLAEQVLRAAVRGARRHQRRPPRATSPTSRRAT